MNLKQELNLQLFADAGTLVNASGNYVNAYSVRRARSRMAAV